MTNNKTADLPNISDCPPIPTNGDFTLSEIKKMTTPHPYCIGTKHIEYCESGILDEYSIERAEKRGAVCETCKAQRKQLSFSEHKTETVLFIAVPDNSSSGLRANTILFNWLQQNNDKMQELGISGYAFLSKNNN